MNISTQHVKMMWPGLAVIIIIQLFSLGYQLFANAERIVYIDNARLLNNYQGMVDARKAFEAKAATWQANIDSLTSDVMGAIKHHEREVAGLSKKEKELSEELIKTKQQQLQNYQQAIQQQSAQEDSQMTERVLTNVNAFLSKYGEKNNYKIIMGANASGNIIYAQNGLDITDEVLAVLNEQYLGS